jgi:hypothetical protein
MIRNFVSLHLREDGNYSGTLLLWNMTIGNVIVNMIGNWVQYMGYDNELIPIKIVVHIYILYVTIMTYYWEIYIWKIKCLPSTNWEYDWNMIGMKAGISWELSMAFMGYDMYIYIYTYIYIHIYSQIQPDQDVPMFLWKPRVTLSFAAEGRLSVSQ